MELPMPTVSERPVASEPSAADADEQSAQQVDPAGLPWATALRLGAADVLHVMASIKGGGGRLRLLVGRLGHEGQARSDL